MTFHPTDRDIERMLRERVAHDMPGDIQASIAAAIEADARRGARRWPAWRFPTVNTYAKLIAAAATVLAVAVVGNNLLPGLGMVGPGATPEPSPTLLARGTFVIRDWDKVEFEATREGSGVSGRMTVGQNAGAPADILRVDLRCAWTTEDGLLMIGGHTVGAGGRFAGMPVGSFAAIALGRAPVRAATGQGLGPGRRQQTAWRISTRGGNERR